MHDVERHLEHDLGAHAVEAPVQITYLRADGATVPQSLTLPPTSRTTILVDSLAGLEATELSASITSTAGLPLVVERISASVYNESLLERVERLKERWTREDARSA